MKIVQPNQIVPGFLKYGSAKESHLSRASAFAKSQKAYGGALKSALDYDNNRSKKWTDDDKLNDVWA